MSSAIPSPAPATEPGAIPRTAEAIRGDGRLLDLVRRLIDYGRALAAALRQQSGIAEASRAFGSNDIAVILARIAQGLLRAAALEGRLMRDAARPDEKPARAAAAPVAAARTPPHAAQARPAGAAARPPARLPTAKQIAAEVRRRPIGAVLADICRDLGIMPNHRLWRDLSEVIIAYGGNLAALYNDVNNRLFPLPAGWAAIRSPAQPPPSLAPAFPRPP